MPVRIPVADPGRTYQADRAAIDDAVHRVLESGRYLLGDEVASFESEMAAWLGAPHAIGVASGTDALQLALRGLGIAAGDEVVTVSHTAVATVAAIELAGAIPVLVDVVPGSLTIDPSAIAGVIGPRTKAIVAVHLYGHPAAMRELREVAEAHDLRLVEDCAQAAGATLGDRKVGTLAHAAAFSFYPTKNLGAVGDGGLVVTSDATCAERVRALRQYGWDDHRLSHEPGVNSRLDEIQAAILRVKLRGLDEAIARRRRIAARYVAALQGADLVLPAETPDVGHAYHLFVVRTPRRAELERFLRDRGIGTGRHYEVPVHAHPAYRGRIRSSALPVTELAAQEVVSLPLYPELRDDEVDEVSMAVRAALA